MKGLHAFAGLLEGLKLGTIQSLDSMSDAHVSKIFEQGLRRVAEATQLAKPRQKRLLQLLRDAAHMMHEEL